MEVHGESLEGLQMESLEHAVYSSDPARKTHRNYSRPVKMLAGLSHQAMTYPAPIKLQSYSILKVAALKVQLGALKMMQRLQRIAMHCNAA